MKWETIKNYLLIVFLLIAVLLVIQSIGKDKENKRVLEQQLELEMNETNFQKGILNMSIVLNQTKADFAIELNESINSSYWQGYETGLYRVAFSVYNSSCKNVTVLGVEMKSANCK
jgi:regulatory protein YycI of two-component signal transduction system YycFG